MKVLIFGAGGVGSVAGGFLARMGHDVTLLGRAWHLDAIKKDGLRITGIWGDYRIKAFDLFTDAAQISTNPPEFDLILLTVKSFDTEKAVNALLPLMGEKTTLLCLQNGLGNIETILKKIRSEQLLIGRVIFGVETNPGVVKITVNADDVVIGAVAGSTPTLSPERAAALFNLSKIPARAVKDIIPFIWAKVIYNCTLNGICALRGIPYGKILESRETRDWMEAVVKECYSVAAKNGIALTPPNADEYLKLLIGTLIPRTAAHFPSMLRDIQKGRRTEIDALNGAISSMGREAGIPTPANDRVGQELGKKWEINFK